MSRVVAPVGILLLFASVLLGIDRLAFRDIGHFYTPLYDYIASRSSGEGLPLWNPLDQTGIPLVGETTTAVFYPVRWVVFSLPISRDIAIGLYGVLHLMLAASTARYAACRAGISPTAASIAGVTYALSGSVLFLYTNPPFLVGAAWLPLLLSALIDRREATQFGRVLVAGTVMALMILGGDPHTVLNAMVVAVAVGLLRWAKARKENPDKRVANLSMDSRPSGTSSLQNGFSSPRLFSLVASGLLAILMSLPQIAASVSWSAQSDRVISEADSDWLSPPQPGSRRGQAYQFSVAPWHVAELVTPNAFGSLLPENHRLSSLIRGEGRVWTPSIYMSLLVAIALTSTVIGLGQRQRDCESVACIKLWLGVAVAASLVSLGHFGFVWWIQNATGRLAHVDSGAGGLYWWLYHFVPGYDSLRYPAKWLPIATFAASMVTGGWIDQLSTQVRSTRAAIAVLAIGMAIGMIGVSWLRYHPNALIHDADTLPFDPFWGPLDIAGGLREVQYSIVHSIVVLASIGLVMSQFFRTRWSLTRTTRFLWVIVTLDMMVFGAGMIARVPAGDASERAGDSGGQPDAMTLRTRTGKGWPRDWREHRDSDRLIEVETSGEIAWFGRWHLAQRGHVFNSMTSIRSRSMAMFWNATNELTGEMSAEQRSKFWESLRDWLRIEQVVNVSERSNLVSGYQLADVSWAIDTPHPSFRVHFDWSEHGRGDPSVDDFKSLLRQVSEQTHRPSVFLRDGLHREAAPDLAPHAVSEPILESELLIENETADSVAVTVHVAATCLLERTTYQDGHWHATLVSLDSGESQAAAVHRVDYLKQGVLVPAGRWRVVFEYSPWWMTPAIVGCIAGWGIVCVSGVVLYRRNVASFVA